MKLNAGIVGCGNIAKFYFAALEKSGLELKWVCDILEEPACTLAAKYKAKYTSNYKDILKDNNVDLVIITCNTSAHKEICINAINQNKAIICEKTLSLNPDDSYEIIKRSNEKNTILYTAYMKRFIPAVEKAVSLRDRIGKIVSTHIRTYQPWGNLWETNPNDGFFHTPQNGVSTVKKNYGGGILLCGGSHLLDLVIFLLGRPHKLYAYSYTPENRDYDLHTTALMETKNGIVHFDALAHSLGRIGFLKDGWDEQIRIVGTEGILEIKSSMWDQPYTKASMVSHYDNSKESLTEYLFEPLSPFDRLLSYFCDDIKKGKQDIQSKLTGYEVDELIDHIKKSASSGKAITIHWRL